MLTLLVYTLLSCLCSSFATKESRLSDSNSNSCSKSSFNSSFNSYSNQKPFHFLSLFLVFISFPLFVLISLFIVYCTLVLSLSLSCLVCHGLVAGWWSRRDGRDGRGWARLGKATVVDQITRRCLFIDHWE